MSEFQNNKNRLSQAQKVIIIMWLSFVMAGIATGVFFSVINPEALRACVTFPEMSHMGAYTVGFLLFWLLTVASSLLAYYFLRGK